MYSLLNTNVKDTAITVLSSAELWGAIIATISIILLGYILVKIKVFKAEWKVVINNIVLKVAIPVLCFQSFMASCKNNELTQYGIILGVSFAFYIALMIIAELWVRYFPKMLPKSVQKTQIQVNFEGQEGGTIAKQVNPEGKILTDSDQKRALVMWNMSIFGSAVFFGYPIITALWGDNDNAGLIAANLWTIPYKVFIQSYSLMVISGVKFQKGNAKQWAKEAFVNPIFIPTMIGLILWLTQLIPGASEFGKNFEHGTHGWFEWNVTMPYLFKPIQLLAGMASPLIWLSIGMTLATANVKAATKDKWIWIFSIEKLILIPLLTFLIMWPLVSNGLILPEVGVAMVILAATPPATAVTAYCMQYKVCEEFVVECSALTTLLTIVALPVWVIISQIVFDIYV